MKISTLLPFTTLLIPLVCHADLVAHWALEEGTGTTAADSTANAQTGTIAGGALWTTADLPPVPSGTTAALQMDGIDDQIDIVGYKGISGTGDRTISAWIKTGINSTAQNKAIVSWGSNVGTQKWTFRIQDQNGTAGAIRIEANGGFLVGNTVVTDAQWHHVAVTWADDGTPDILDAKLYVDGVLDAEFGSIDTPPSASQSVAINTAVGADVRIGQDFQTAVNHNWDGAIDEVRIYDEALDAATIALLALDTPVLTSFEASEEAVASGSPVELSWVSDATNDTLVVDNGVGDVSGMTMITVNPTTTTTYTLTGTRGGETGERQVTVLVDSAPVINVVTNLGSATLLEGQSTTIVWDVFGETSISINGTDVSGLDRTDLSPAETTTYTLSATNAFGTTTSEFTLTVIDGSNPDLGWRADGLPDGALAQWDPTINATGNNGITFNSATGGTVQSGVSNFSSISSWVNSPGYNLASNPNDSWQDGLGDLPTKEDVSWEMVFRPGDFTGTHTLFNTGGNGQGTAIVLTDSTLDFRFQAADNDDQRIIVSADLSAIGSATDFFHIVATANVGPGVPGTAALYVNGLLVAGPTTSIGVINDWDGGDLAELGKGANIPTSTAFPFEAFTGDIAVFNYYGSRVLSASQVSDKYAALGGAGGDLTITKIDYDLEAGEMRFTFSSVPNRFYAFETTVDLAAETWIEIDDSVPSVGTETTIVLSIEAFLPSPGSPRRFFRVLPGL
ncbi:LamG domain-containing protein [Akkermansiaceae bacterium]|nr:LamG domain-containing protein [Akkermansiaceae bacterium]